MSFFDSLNPVLSTDPVKAQNQKNILIDALASFEYQKTNEGTFIPLREGKRIEDAHGHGVTLDDHVKGIAEKFFDFKKADDRSTPPAGGGGSGTSGQYKPKDEAEYAKLMTDRSIPLEDRQAIKKAWSESKQ